MGPFFSRKKNRKASTHKILTNANNTVFFSVQDFAYWLIQKIFMDFFFLLPQLFKFAIHPTIFIIECATNWFHFKHIQFKFAFSVRMTFIHHMHSFHLRIKNKTKAKIKWINEKKNLFCHSNSLIEEEQEVVDNEKKEEKKIEKKTTPN